MIREYEEVCPISQEVVNEFSIEEDREPAAAPCPGPHLPKTKPGESAKEYIKRIAISPFTPHNSIIKRKK